MNLKILIYCTKKGLILRDYRGKAIFDRFVLSPHDRPFTTDDRQPVLNGKVLAECDSNISNIYGCIDKKNQPYYEVHSCCVFHEYWLSEKSYLSHDELVKYLGEYKGLVGKAIGIWHLHIFDKPKELKDFYIKGSYPNAEQMFTDEIQINGEWFHPLKKAPQNMCYAFDCYGNKYVIISIQPQWVMLILNGLKTIEVRRKVLKEML